MAFAPLRPWLAREAVSASPKCLHVSRGASSSCVTRLAPSKRIPGTTGVFCTHLIKKFAPLEIFPSALSSTHLQPFPAAASFPSEAGMDRFPPSQSVFEAPPYVVNLVHAPRKTISLRRFLALRAMFSSDRYLHVATPGGWYLLLPSKAVPLPDLSGLQAWLQRRHYRYLDEPPEVGNTDIANATRHSGWSFGRLSHSTAQAWRIKKLSLLRKEEQSVEAAADAKKRSETAGEWLGTTAKSSRPFAPFVDRSGQGIVDMEDDNEKGCGSVGGANLGSKFDQESGNEPDLFVEAAATDDTAVSDESAFAYPHGSTLRRRKQQTPRYIPEEHLFEINDGVPMELPPRDDVASPEYWKQHRSRMAFYQSDANTASAAMRDEFAQEVLRGLRTPPEEALVDPTTAPIRSKDAALRMREQQQHIGQLLSEREALSRGEQLFQILTHRANVTLHVDDDTGLVTLMPIVDLHPGDELLLHYGREWWTQRLLFPLFLAAQDSEMGAIRWIEKLCSSEDEGDVVRPFPRLVPARRTCRKATKASHRRKVVTAADTCPQEDAEQRNSLLSKEKIQSKKAADATTAHSHALYDKETGCEATDAAVLVFAIRRSCQDRSFFELLVRGGGGGAPPVFDLEACDVEVPIRVLRRMLLKAFMGTSHGIEGREMGCESFESSGGAEKRDEESYFV